MGMVNSTCRCSSRLFFPALACTTLKLEAGEGESLMLLRGEAPLEGGGGGYGTELGLRGLSRCIVKSSGEHDRRAPHVEHDAFESHTGGA